MKHNYKIFKRGWVFSVVQEDTLWNKSKFILLFLIKAMQVEVL